MKYPTNKSLYWILYHKQERLFLIFLNFVIAGVGIVYGISMIKKSPAGIVFFGLAVYGTFFFFSNVVKLYKEFKQ